MSSTRFTATSLLVAGTVLLLLAVAALERANTPEARHLLEKLSAGVDSAETRAAKTTLDRLKHR